MTVAEVRQKFLKFFETRGHAIVPSASLVPENDPTTLFTGSGMQPLIPYLLGGPHPQGKRLVNSQRCFRSEDIEEVGDNRHTTFFEMLGNWSLGDYFKKEQLAWCFEFLTRDLGIPKERLWVTCFAGDETLGLPRDTESAEIWEEIGVSKEHIFFYDSRKNWWSRAGVPENMPIGEPGGPDSEIFYEFTKISHDPKFGEECHPNCECGRFMEIGNSVFMEYRKASLRSDLSSDLRSDLIGSFEKLPQRNVDFGGGLERITAAVNDEPDIFLSSHKYVIDSLEVLTKTKYADYRKEYRVIADHAKAAAFLIAAGARPSNKERGYFVRRLLRRAILLLHRKINRGSVPGKFTPIATFVSEIVKAYKEQYPDLKLAQQEVEKQFTEEETAFRISLMVGMKQLEHLSGQTISGKDAFVLFSTYGLPFELIQELAKERGIVFDETGFRDEMKNHQEISRAGAERKFKGGLADTSEMSVKYHTATHLLHQALRDVLGKEVQQKGSNITPERLRFDFAFPRKMTDEEKKKVVEIVNEKIKTGLLVNKITLPLEEAKKSGALHFFDEKYPDQVLVHFIGDSLDTAYSKEFCGGPHVTNTGVLGGGFKILKEEAVSVGVRRIKATLSDTLIS